MDSDFDKLANLPPAWDHNAHYHDLLLKFVPSNCETALDIGCGTGEFSRKLAERSRRVVAVDNSRESIRIATKKSKDFANVEYRLADATSVDLPAEGFDFVASIATFHHLPFAETLEKLKAALKPGGTLAIIDIYETKSVFDYLIVTLALPSNVAMRVLKTGRLTERPEVKRAWAEHGESDRYPTFDEIRGICEKSIPGAIARRLLFWRYLLVWRKPV